jgi:hypothetical protein
MISEMPGPIGRPITGEQLSDRIAPAGTDKATADRRLASYPRSVQAPAEWGRHPLSRTPAQARRNGTVMRSGSAANSVMGSLGVQYDALGR